MTFSETAAALRRLADGIDVVVSQMGKDANTGHPKPVFYGDFAVGAAMLLCYIRNLITISERPLDGPTMLVILEAVSRDSQLFPGGVGAAMWQAEEEDEDEDTRGE